MGLGAIQSAEQEQDGCLLTTQQVEQYVCNKGREIEHQYKDSLYISATLTIHSPPKKTNIRHGLASVSAYSQLKCLCHSALLSLILGIVVLPLCNTVKHNQYQNKNTH